MRRAWLLALGWLSLVVGGCFQVAGYDDFRFVEPFTRRLTAQRIDALDLLFVVDESKSTEDQQRVLAQTLDRFLGRLLNPRCIDETGSAVEPQPAGPLDPCPAGSQRELGPVLDIHIGVITTSLGGHGGDACTETPAENRKAHLVPDATGGYQKMGFLVWDPEQRRDPPGEDDAAALTARLTGIIAGLGIAGCGFEAPLEAWYRFLVDPRPHEEVIVENGEAVAVGLDQTLLDQRAAFLRADSLVAVVMLSDENDCSIRDGGQGYLAAQIRGGPGLFHLPRPRAACATDPLSDCCRSCAQAPGEGCDTSQDDCDTRLGDGEDPLQLRCWDQKRRFGMDLLWPVERYTAGLSSEQITDRDGNLTENPLLAGRDPGLVLVSGLVGVPWQDIARRRADGTPDLRAGLDASGEPRGGFMNAGELRARGVWPLILGEPATRTPPADPLMQESIAPRSGTHPVWPEIQIAPPDSERDANPINGHEAAFSPTSPDLQFACVYDLEEPRDCASMPAGCECTVASEKSPLCQNENDEFEMVQHRAGARPGLRQLELLESIGSQAVVASACWAQIDDPESEDYGYNPGIFRAILDRLRPALRNQLCVAEEVAFESDGRARCALIEARKTADGACTCDPPARVRPSDDLAHVVEAARTDPLYAEEQWSCFCELPQLSGVDLDACRSQVEEPVANVFGTRVDGWCLVDAARDPPLGTPELTAGCASERRLVRLVGAALPAPGASLFLDCR